MNEQLLHLQHYLERSLKKHAGKSLLKAPIGPLHDAQSLDFSSPFRLATIAALTHHPPPHPQRYHRSACHLPSRTGKYLCVHQNEITDKPLHYIQRHGGSLLTLVHQGNARFPFITPSLL